MISKTGPKVSFGQIVATPDALEALQKAGQSAQSLSADDKMLVAARCSFCILAVSTPSPTQPAGATLCRRSGMVRSS